MFLKIVRVKLNVYQSLLFSIWDIIDAHLLIIYNNTNNMEMQIISLL